MRKVFLISAVLFSFLFLSQSNVCAQTAPSKSVSVKAKQGSDNSNVAQPTDEKPREKSKKRGYCYIWFDNPTGYYVDVWVEDIYQGRLSPYSTSVRINVWTPGSWTKWYAQTSGGTYSWANNSYCNDSRRFTITL